MMMFNNILIFSLLLSVSRGQPNAIKEGDRIFFHGLKVGSDRMIYFNVEKDPTIFTIKKFPFYTSPNNVILTGQSVLLTSRNQTCCVDTKTKYVKCECSKNIRPSLRILDKHGKDKVVMMNRQLIKFRETNNSIDCSIKNGSPLLCNLKSMNPLDYGFVIFKVPSKAH